MSFPLHPTDDQTFVNGTGTLYIYDSTQNTWSIEGSPALQVILGDATTYATEYTNTYAEPLLGFTPENTANKGVANGYAPLNNADKVPLQYLPSNIQTYEGLWNATTNSPHLQDGTGIAGNTYIVNPGGVQNLGQGDTTYIVGEYVIYDGTNWESTPTGNAVASVNGFTGAVVLDASNVGAVGYTVATLDPTKAGTGVVLSNGNLTATLDSTSTVLDTVPMSNGNYYWEVAVGAGTFPAIGIATINVNLNNSLGNDAYGWSWFNDGLIYHNNSEVTNTSSFTNGDILGFLLNLNTCTLQFYKNGTALVTIDIPSGTYYAALSGFGLGTVGTCNFGASSFAHIVPIGYSTGIITLNPNILTNTPSLALNQNGTPQTVAGGMPNFAAGIKTPEIYDTSAILIESSTSITLQSQASQVIVPFGLSVDDIVSDENAYITIRPQLNVNEINSDTNSTVNFLAPIYKDGTDTAIQHIYLYPSSTSTIVELVALTDVSCSAIANECPGFNYLEDSTGNLYWPDASLFQFLNIIPGQIYTLDSTFATEMETDSPIIYDTTNFVLGLTEQYLLTVSPGTQTVTGAEVDFQGGIETPTITDDGQGLNITNNSTYGSGEGIQITSNSGNIQINLNSGDEGNGALRIAVNNNEALKIDTGGNVNINSLQDDGNGLEITNGSNVANINLNAFDEGNNGLYINSNSQQAMIVDNNAVIHLSAIEDNNNGIQITSNTQVMGGVEQGINLVNNCAAFVIDLNTADQGNTALRVMAPTTNQALMIDGNGNTFLGSGNGEQLILTPQSQPSAYGSGAMYYDDATNTLMLYSNSNWIPVTPYNTMIFDSTHQPPDANFNPGIINGWLIIQQLQYSAKFIFACTVESGGSYNFTIPSLAGLFQSYDSTHGNWYQVSVTANNGTGNLYVDPTGMVNITGIAEGFTLITGGYELPYSLLSF